MNVNLILSAIAFPVAVVLVGTLLRFIRDVPLVPSTDIFGMLVVLDFTIIQDTASFSVAVANDLKGSIPELAAFSLFVCGVMWAICIVLLEKKLEKYHKDKSANGAIGLVAGWISACFLALSALVMHFLVLAGRISLHGVVK